MALTTKCCWDPASTLHRLYSTSSPEWNTLLTFPVYTPCLTDNIDVQLWDYQGTGPDQLLATLTLRFSDILSDQIYPTWFNLYKVPRAEM